jgi:hypothetical protein
MNTVRKYPYLVNVIVFCWILTSFNGLMNSISESREIIKKNELVNKKKIKKNKK